MFKNLMIFGPGLLLTAGLAGAVTIDTFDTTQTLQIAAGGVTPTSTSGAVATGASAVGGGRGMVLSRTGGTGATNGLVNAVSLAGALQLNSEVSTTANLFIVWDGGTGNSTLDVPGFTAVDFTDGGASDRIRMRILSADLGFNIVLRAYTTVPGSFYEWAFSPGATAVPTNQDLLFAAATAVGGPGSFASIRALTMQLDTPAAGDISLDFIETFGNPPNDTTPEPSTFALAGLGLIAASVIRRRK